MDLFEKSAQNPGGWRDASVRMVHEGRGNLHLVDVREPDEWAGELGVIEGAERVPLATVLEAAASWKKEETHILVCRSGNRSGKAAAALHSAGFTRLINMTGGMLAWSAEALPVAR